MKWGVRRYQNKDGSLTPAGQKRYSSDKLFKAKIDYKTAKKNYNSSFEDAYDHKGSGISLSKNKRAAEQKRWEKVYNDAEALNKAKANYKAVKEEIKTENKNIRSDRRDLERKYRYQRGDEIEKYYKEANDFADKHALTPDMVVDDWDRDDFVKEARLNRVSTEDISAVLEYSKLMKVAELKENEVWAKYDKIIKDELIEKYGNVPVKRVLG